MKNIVGLYLAAGNSSRMGRDKLNLPTPFGPLGSLALRAALESALEHTFVVTAREQVPQWLPAYFFEQRIRQKWTHVCGKDAAAGQANSIRRGIHAARGCGADAAVIVLADQPLIHTQSIDALINHFKAEEGRSIIVTTYGGIIAPPILFPKASFDQLLHLQGDQGAKAVVLRDNLFKRIACERAASLFDVDDEADYEQLIRLITYT